MKLGIVGMPESGKSTVFEALTQKTPQEGHRGESRIGTVRVPDPRVDALSLMYKPKKTIYAQVEYFLPPRADKKQEQSMWGLVRDCDAFIHVVRNFNRFGFNDPEPHKDVVNLDQEMIISDLVVVEKRLERMELDKKRGKAVDNEEFSLLTRCLKNIETEKPIRTDPDLASSRLLKGFAFVSAKPTLLLFNNEDEDEEIPDLKALEQNETCMIIRGKLEQELAQMSDEEVEVFLEEFNITASAMDRVIRKSYELLGLISFFTVGEDEVRAWTIKKETEAVDAAEVIHSDIKKGFIRAEVLSYGDLMEAGTFNAARKKGEVRLEGKTYLVQDGDIINFRFNV